MSALSAALPLSHLRREVHDRVDLLRLQHKAHEVGALDVALDKLVCTLCVCVR